MLRRFLIVFAMALVLAPSALAKGGSYVFDGGTPVEQGQVRAALSASSFDFSVVPSTVTVHIAPGTDSRATPGQVWLDAELLDSGSYSWGVVQHEFAHQIDFLVFGDAARATLQSALGSTTWYAGAAHDQLGCERFADLVAWAYWQSPDNVMQPDRTLQGVSAVTPTAFRALVARLLPVRRAPQKRG